MENVNYFVDTWHVDTEPLEDGWCALHQSFEHLEIVKYLVEECVYVLIPIRKTAMEKLVPVHGASEKWLLRSGCIFDTDRKSVVWIRKLKTTGGYGEGWTALHFAGAGGHLHIVKVVLMENYGVDQKGGRREWSNAFGYRV